MLTMSTIQPQARAKTRARQVQGRRVVLEQEPGKSGSVEDQPDGYSHKSRGQKAQDHRSLLQRSHLIQGFLGAVVADQEEGIVGEHSAQSQVFAEGQGSGQEHHDDADGKGPAELDHILQGEAVYEQGEQEPQGKGRGQIAEPCAYANVESVAGDHGDGRKYQVGPQNAPERSFPGPVRLLGEVPGQEHEGLHDEYIDGNVHESAEGQVGKARFIQGLVPVGGRFREVGYRDREHEDAPEGIEHIITFFDFFTHK